MTNNPPPLAVFVRRDEHETMPIVYRWRDNRLYRCSLAEWNRMLNHAEAVK